MNSDEVIINSGQEVLNIAAQHLQSASSSLNESFVKAVKLLEDSQDNIIVSGVGKSGIIAQKLAATLSSMGTFAHFIHPIDAFHGDFGKLMPQDIIILFSHSGETEELIKFIGKAQELHPKTKVILITSNEDSLLSDLADIVILTHVGQEHSNKEFSHIPTTSTTVSIAIGDALDVALQKQNNFRAGQFFAYHPGGNIGNLNKTKVL